MCATQNSYLLPRKTRCLVDWQRKKPYWLLAVMNFSDYFYIAINMCLVAQQNIFSGWGRISLTEEMPTLSASGARGWQPFVKFWRLWGSSNSRNLIF